MKSKSDLQFELIQLRQRYQELLRNFTFQSKVEGNIHFPDTLKGLLYVVNQIATIKWILEDWNVPKDG